MKFRKRCLLLAIMLLCCVPIITACGEHTVKATYEIEVDGTAAESGVIDYAGLAMNVYQDLASNPCGTCPDQPVSVYVGVTAEEITKAMAEAVTRADDIWIVKEQSGDRIVLEEKEIDTAEEPEILAGSGGITLQGDFSPAH